MTVVMLVAVVVSCVVFACHMPSPALVEAAYFFRVLSNEYRSCSKAGEQAAGPGLAYFTAACAAGLAAASVDGLVLSSSSAFSMMSRALRRSRAFTAATQSLNT